MMWRITKSFTMDCMHYLRLFPEGHPCRRPHGHTYTVSVTLAGQELCEDGTLCDFGLIKGCIYDRFDHRDINDVLRDMGKGDLESTAEVLCSVFWDLIDETILREINAGQEARAWVRIEEVAVQEGEGGVARLHPGE